MKTELAGMVNAAHPAEEVYVLFSMTLLAACDPGGVEDASAPAVPSDADWAALTVREKCFSELGDEAAVLPVYDAFEPVVGRHCSGTDHQDIDGIQKVVFVGDSITAGTPPTEPDDYYRVVLTEMLEARFGPLEVADCSAWGARTDDLLLDPHQQLRDCLPETQDKHTLILMTVGGNDMMSVLSKIVDGAPEEQVQDAVDCAAGLLDDAIAWVRAEEASRFPAGVSVVFANVYEFTDATADVHACDVAEAFGFPQPDEEQAVVLRDAYRDINEQYMQTATRHGVDMLFLLENFCGHGFYAGDPGNECFRGEEAERWFDATCIHPNPEGHAQIAQMFYDVVAE